MQTIFDHENDAKHYSRLNVRAMVSTVGDDQGVGIHVTKRNMMHQLADKIVESNKFVDIKKTPDYFYLTAECIVLTPKEFESLCLEKYNLGLNHGRNGRAISWEY